MNLVNEIDVTNWIKDITWKDVAAAPILRPNLTDRGYIEQNKDAISYMVVHSYIKRNIHAYLDRHVDSEFLQRADENEPLSESVRLSAADGNIPYRFIPERAIGLRNDMVQLKNELHDLAIKNIDKQLENDTGASLDMKTMVLELPLIDVAMQNAARRPKWNVKMPEIKPAQKDPQLPDFIKGYDD